MIRKTTESPIEEIHRTRREISDRFHGDVYAIAKDAAARQALSNRPVWKPDSHQFEQESHRALGSTEMELVREIHRL